VNAADAFLDAIVERLAPRVADIVLARLRAEPGFGTPRVATAKNNPTGSARAFRRGARAKAFPTFKHGKADAAEWALVETWWREECAKEAPVDEVQAVLDAASRAPRRKAAA